LTRRLFKNSRLEQATIVRAQGASEDENFEKKPTPSKTDFANCFGIKKYIHKDRFKTYFCQGGLDFLAEQ
jgi:hypothetical protein